MLNTYTLAGTFHGTPAPAVDGTALIIALLVSAVLAIVCIVASVIAFLPPRDHASKHHTAHSHLSDADFKHRIRSVEDSYTAGSISRQEAFHALAAIARQFASVRLNTDVTSHTLADLQHTDGLQSAHMHGMNLLRSTIEGLYPPEFAYEGTNTRSAEVTVVQACSWVTSIIERWDAKL
ncbi:hypothetical protein [Alloscardovia omnicolens]|uniref:hypothetical protein n=1 Tax=Alloscardovia omnicolens TaxID=419015 RepID=UPI003A739D30